MYKVKIVAVRQTEYKDLMDKYENPIENACDMQIGQTFYSLGARPDGLCESAWESIAPFVQKLVNGEGNFFNGWMKNPFSALVSCNDGFRPMSFYLEREED